MDTKAEVALPPKVIQAKNSNVGRVTKGVRQRKGKNMEKVRSRAPGRRVVFLRRECSSSFSLGEWKWCIVFIAWELSAEGASTCCLVGSSESDALGEEGEDVFLDGLRSLFDLLHVRSLEGQRGKGRTGHQRHDSCDVNNENVGFADDGSSGGGGEGGEGGTVGTATSNETEKLEGW